MYYVNLALKLVMCLNKLENVYLGILIDVLVEVSGTQLFFHWIRLKIFVHKHTCNTTLYVHHLLRYQRRGI